MKNITHLAINYASQLLNEKLTTEFSYHNLPHTLEVLENVIEIGSNTSISEEKLELLKLAAIFHDTGMTISCNDHEVNSCKIAKEFFSKNNIKNETIEEIEQLILSTNLEKVPNTIGQKILRDSDILHTGKKKFYSKSLLLKSEIEALEKREIPELSWVDSTLEFLGNTGFFTKYAKDNYSDRKQKNIIKLKKKRDMIMEKANKKNEISDQDEKVSKKEKKQIDKKTGRGVETMFRNTIRTHVEFSSMADSKANIMISVNTLILTAIVAFLAKSLDANPHLIIPSAVLTIVSLTTLITAITVTRPKITSGVFTAEDIKARKTNLLFFGNFYNMDLKTFEWGMQEMIMDNEYLYGSMIKDFYFLGQVLGEKYKKLRLCYNFFMYGIVISIIAFAVAILFAPANAGLIP